MRPGAGMWIAQAPPSGPSLPRPPLERWAARAGGLLKLFELAAGVLALVFLLGYARRHGFGAAARHVGRKTAGL